MNGKIIFRSFLCLIAYAGGLLGLQAQVKQVQYLSGTGYQETVSWDFFCTGGRQSGYWTKIEVPSCWEQQGFGSYNYGRDYKTNGKNSRFNDEKGLYKHHFAVPSSWKDKEVFIVFEGSMTDTEVKINGRSAGAVHQGAFYRFKYNITDKLLTGKANLLEVTVSKMSSEPSVNNAERLADYWVFGGIFRPVYLEAVPRQHIDHVAIDAKANGSFAMQAFIKNANKKLNLLTEIVDSKGAVVSSNQQVVNAGDSVVTINTTLAGVKTWTAETPALYSAVVSLKDGTQTLYKATEKFGFRTIEIRHGDGVYINGVKVKFKGTNRHCWWPESARTLNEKIQLQDALLLKEMNMNAVRCSHYPPDKRFLEFCDSLGIYVLNELAGWQKAYSTKAGRLLVRELVVRDVNHPSIIFWDNGNEGGTNKELDPEFPKWDLSKRPVIHPHHRPGNDFNGIDCNHYEDYYSTKKILEDSLIYMPTEFLHAQDDGGAGAAMEDFWELHWGAKKSAGGFIWAMVDEGVVRTDMGNVIDANGLNANDGILGPHREKEGSFYALREIYSPVKIRMGQLPKDFNGSIVLENRYHFTNLNQCTFKWALVNYRQAYSNLAGFTVMEKGKAAAPAIAPGNSGTLHLGLPAGFLKYDALMLTATDPFGKEIYKWTWKIADNAKLLTGMFNASSGSSSGEALDSVYVLKGGENTVWLSKKTGLLTGTRNAAMDNLSFRNGPVLAQGNAVVVSSRLYKDGNNSVVEFTYEGNLKYTRWTMQEDGWLSLEYEYTLDGSYPFAGVNFNYPENFILGVKWLGKGPYRQWKNRMAGTPVNVWEKLYNNTQTGYWPMVYPEFKGYYGDVTWMEFNTVEGKFYVASRDTGLFVRLFDFYALSSGVKPHPELPGGNISFLDCIPPIGTKLALNINYNTAALGPQSEPAKLDKPVKRTLLFYFGLPKTTEAKEQYSRPDVDNVF
ncbi:glycoside hydrolase family 2 TIM barrel-domain containing protein [Filimonas effusa]|uniref:Beta-galactosidase n=1 Tax=Filimonas effusa TaxID=2508721 RepID=A0A4Q1D8T9_9BACT|nr:glycoside hydrolase family 2 TIM barrel-domain containing protein [Filimonas effusa]RXK85777.1 glycoside hydrolase family 2 [Filimonas effusa]